MSQTLYSNSTNCYYYFLTEVNAEVIRSFLRPQFYTDEYCDIRLFSAQRFSLNLKNAFGPIGEILAVRQQQFI